MMYSPTLLFYNVLFYKNTNKFFLEVTQPDYMNHISQNLQGILSNNKDISVINKYYSSKQDFIYSKPFIDKNNTVVTHSYINLNKSTDFFSKYWWFKLKSSESFKKCSTPNIGKEMNEYIFEETFNKLSSYIQNEYKKNGKKIIFGEDIVIFAEKKDDGLKWTSNDIDVINSNNNIVIRTPIMYTSIDAVPKRVAGMTYVKVISPAQVIEWITNKSFQTD